MNIKNRLNYFGLIFIILPGDKMNKSLILSLVLLVQLSGCAGHKKIVESPPESYKVKESDPISFWLDKETDTVHKIASENGVKKIVSVIKYNEGKPLEVMKIIISDSNNGKLHWIYFVPSTKYVVELTESSEVDSGIKIDWKNRTPEGLEDSGSDILVRCTENGDLYKKEIYTEAELPDNFSFIDKNQQ